MFVWQADTKNISAIGFDVAHQFMFSNEGCGDGGGWTEQTNIKVIFLLKTLINIPLVGVRYLLWCVYVSYQNQPPSKSMLL